MNKEATIIRGKLKEMLSEDNAFSVDLENGGRAFIKPKEDAVNIVDINAPKIDAITPKRGTKTYEHVLKKILEMGYNTVRIRLQSKDSRNAIKKLVDKNILLNPREEMGLSIDRYPTVFDINADAVEQELKNINEMRDHIKQILRENMEELEEDYPSSFDMDHFASLKSFKKRVEYAEEQLSRISSGTGRIVYKIDDEKVLKLARNKKGVAQNRTEADVSDDPVAGDIFADVYNYDDEFRWIEMELVKKMNPKDFERIVGFKFNDYAKFIENQDVKANKGHKEGIYHLEDEKRRAMWESEFIADVVDFIVNFGVPAGDLARTSSYGIVQDGGEEEIVLVDYGLSSDVYECYYC